MTLICTRMQLCNDACEDLQQQHKMVHDQAFSLFESMTALELMDPKMDQCTSIPLVSIQSLLDSGEFLGSRHIWVYGF